MDRDDGEIRLDDIIELDIAASPASNAERARQQAAFHAREVKELAEAISNDAATDHAQDRSRDPRQTERTHHHTLELLCREIADAFDWLDQRNYESIDLNLGIEQIRAGYETSPEIGLLRQIAETQYPLLTAITAIRQNGVGLLTETRLSLKHAARGRALADTMAIDGAETLLAGWLKQVAIIGDGGAVHVLVVHRAIEWLIYLAQARAKPGHARMLEDDLEATIYLGRATLDEAGFIYAGPEEPPPGY